MYSAVYFKKYQFILITNTLENKHDWYGLHYHILIQAQSRGPRVFEYLFWYVRKQ